MANWQAVGRRGRVPLPGESLLTFRRSYASRLRPRRNNPSDTPESFATLHRYPLVPAIGPQLETRRPPPPPSGLLERPWHAGHRAIIRQRLTAAHNGLDETFLFTDPSAVARTRGRNGSGCKHGGAGSPCKGELPTGPPMCGASYWVIPWRTRSETNRRRFCCAIERRHRLLGRSA
jgi:hypothetical protein